MRVWKLLGFLSTYLVFTTMLFFILNIKSSIAIHYVALITASLLALGGIIKKWLK